MGSSTEKDKQTWVYSDEEVFGNRYMPAKRKLVFSKKL